MRTEEEKKQQAISYLERTAKHVFKYGDDQIWAVRKKDDKWFSIVLDLKEEKIQKINFGRWATYKEDYKHSVFNYKDPKMKAIKQFKALKERINEYMATA